MVQAAMYQDRLPAEGMSSPSPASFSSGQTPHQEASPALGQSWAAHPALSCITLCLSYVSFGWSPTAAQPGWRICSDCCQLAPETPFKERSGKSWAGLPNPEQLLEWHVWNIRSASPFQSPSRLPTPSKYSLWLFPSWSLSCAPYSAVGSAWLTQALSVGPLFWHKGDISTPPPWPYQLFINGETLAPNPASSLRHLQSGEAEEEPASHSHVLDQHLSCHEPHKHKVVCNIWVFRPKEPATYRSHCCGGRTARGFIFDAAIQVGGTLAFISALLTPNTWSRALEDKFASCLPSLTLLLQGIRPRRSTWASWHLWKLLSDIHWPKGSPNQAVKNDEKLQLCEAKKQANPCRPCRDNQDRCTPDQPFGLCSSWEEGNHFWYWFLTRSSRL